MKNTNEKNIISVVTAMTAAGMDAAQIEAVVKSLMTNSNGINVVADNGATVIIGDNNKIVANAKKAAKKNHRGSRGKKHSSKNTETTSVTEVVEAAEKTIETTTVDSKHVMLSGAKYFLQDKKEKVYVGARISFPKKGEMAKVTFVVRTKDSMSTHEYEVNVDERGERKFIASVPLFVLMENAKELGLENKAVLVDVISAETPERLNKLYALAKDAKVSIYGSICVTKSDDTPEIIKIKGVLDGLRKEAKNANKGNTTTITSVEQPQPEKTEVKTEEIVPTEENKVKEAVKTAAEINPWKMDWKSVGFSVVAED